jgi:branched-chain amino acid transport system permease protein
MTDLVQVVYTGLVLGSSYAVMAVGLTFIWGGLRFLNLAHGALYSVGAFGAYSIVVSSGAPPLAGLLAAMVISGAAGAVMHLGVYRVLLRRPDGEISTLVAGLGLAILVQGLLVLKYSPLDKSLPSLVSGGFRLPGDVVGTMEGLTIIGAAVLSIGALGLFLARTTPGIAVRAIANDRTAAELLGVNTGALVFVVMVAGSALAGLSGVLLSSFYFVSVGSGFTALLKGLIVTIAGGLGSVRGTLVAALCVGFIEAAVALWIGAQWSLPILFAVVLAFLVGRPQGLAGRIDFAGTR